MTWQAVGSSRCSLLRRLRSAIRLDRAEVRAAAEAIVTLAVVRAALTVVDVSRVRRAVERTQPGMAGDANYPAAVRRAVSRAARTIPNSACLPQALVAQRMLLRAEHPAELKIGVRRVDANGGGAPLSAHAWVISGSRVVVGDSDGTELASYVPLARVPADR